MRWLLKSMRSAKIVLFDVVCISDSLLLNEILPNLHVQHCRIVQRLLFFFQLSVVNSSMKRTSRLLILRLFFHVTLTPNRYILHVIVIDCLSPCIPCIPCIPMYTLYTYVYHVYLCIPCIPCIPMYTLFTYVYPVYPV